MISPASSKAMEYCAGWSGAFRRSEGRWLLLLIAWLLPLVPWSAAAETANPVAMHKTLIVLKVDSEEPLEIRSRFQTQPPTILLEFPAKRVVGSLPERSMIGAGAIQAILTAYHENATSQPRRFIQSLQIVLSAPYAYHVRSEPGRVVVEIEHPASISSAQVEVGLRGGTIIGALGPRSISERFRAMQDALASATPTTWKLQLTSSSRVPAGMLPLAPIASPPSKFSVVRVARPAPLGTPRGRRPARGIPARQIALLVCLLFVGTAIYFERTRFGEWFRIEPSKDMRQRLSSGMLLVDQLVWRAFERQGYQLVVEKELLKPPVGSMRILTKDGAKAALFCTGNGPFFEKQAVERFVGAMREANVDQGFLVAAGSFTVPAQRFAKEHQITLIGREELVGLLNAGAASEYMNTQLEQHQANLAEAKETLRQYAGELDALRRQRNEASWYLGEERAKTAKLEADLAAMTQQLHQYESEMKRWEQEAATQRKQWEESQWYLGESRSRTTHLEQQVTGLQESVQRAEAVEQERADAVRSLQDAVAQRESLETTLAELQRQLEVSATREREMDSALAQLKSELKALRTHWGERRSTARAKVADAFLELRHGADEEPCFAGTPRDVSRAGLGLETDYEMPGDSLIHVRLSLPDSDEPIESSAQLIWQQTDTQPSRYHSGYQFLDLSPSARARLEQAIGQTQLPT